MPRETQTEGWTWVPAEGQKQGRRRAVGGLVLAIACLSVGIVIGRISISTQAVHTAAHRPAPAQVPISTVAEAPPELSGSSEPNRSATKAAAPTLALGTEPDEKQADIGSPARTDTPARFNPGAAGSPTTVEKLGSAAQAQSSRWSEYRNEKYGLTLKYPHDLFVVEPTAEAGDGQVFVTRKGDARLLVGALLNDSGFTPTTLQDHIARQSYGKYEITYQPKGRTWFVLSGKGGGKVFYEKVMFSCSGRLISSFAMIYPAHKRGVFNPIVEQMENTFRAGNACERAGLQPG